MTPTRTALLLLVTLIGGLLGTAARADDLSLASAPPVVVRTVPVAGSTGVDPTLTEIKVTFSKEMEDASWSWVMQTAAQFPKTVGTPKYLEDARTCVLPVKLEPGKTYVLWLNSEKLGNFKDRGGRSAIPYLLVFSTRE